MLQALTHDLFELFNDWLEAFVVELRLKLIHNFLENSEEQVFSCGLE